MADETPKDQRSNLDANPTAISLPTTKSEKLNTINLVDELHEITNRALGLELAILGASKECQMDSYGDALAQLARDVVVGLESLEKKYCDGVKTQPEQDPE